VKRRAFLAVTAAGGVLAYGRAGKPGLHPASHPAGRSHPAAPRAAAATAIAYARAQAGKPYLWGGTGPDAFDCSGLVMAAWASAGVTIPRTSQEQWAGLPHVTDPQPGDLVFYAGADGTIASPGHVVLYIGHGQVIQAYATGYPVMITSLASVNAGPLTGYARPRT
jgi:peptidoglycan DL-endopeptidase CwlO